MRRGEAVDAVACIADDQSRRVDQASVDAIFDLGRRMRAARLRRGWAQEELGSAVGASSSTISRMELGGGASVPLGLWVAVGDALGLDVVAADVDRPQVYAVAIRRLAARGGWAPTGGWAAVRQVAGALDPAEQVPRTGELERPSRRDPRLRRRLLPAERVVVRLVATVTDLEVEGARLKRRVDSHRASAPDGLVVGGCLVVVRTTNNVRRAGRLWRRSSMGWINALSEPLAQAPAWWGVVWLTPRGTGWLPVV